MKQRIHLSSDIRDLLAEIPETSMGAQILDICLDDGRIIPNISIYNGEDAMIDEPFDIKKIIAFRQKNGKIWRLTKH
ncbi:hypothetical protein [Geminisphaera colitermitum]|uniref:hypothetical protein n=1 Tax=Geminisphaera colitermitum TaxID=1148786 RepID=UPI00019653CD|nr:hypothetical protein [Geminisphaera colitermitum]